ncbi:MAG TPA: hypothetical protein VJZ72_06835 [Candidatus Limnocylindrales bacterium]|nr:hypothetical protein [Candidatus Limnocylindrales bacterium]
MNARWFRLLIGPMIALAALAAGCSSAASVAPSTQPKPSAAPPSVVAAPSANSSPTAPPALTETFTSALHGLSISHPEGWAIKAATQPWSSGEVNFEDPHGDFIYEPSLTDHLFLAMRSQPLGSTGADQWAADQATLGECPQTAPITVDGTAGVIGAADCNLALVSTGGRGYVFRLYTSGDEGWLDSVYDRAWFEEVLATVDLRPTDAVDTVPSASP